MTAPIRRPRADSPGGTSQGRASQDRASRGGTSQGRASQGGASGGGASRGGRGRRADPVRRVAYDVLIAVEQRDAYANLLLPSMLAERGLEGRDAALATELTYGTLRGRGSYDAILGLCSDRRLDRVDPAAARGTPARHPPAAGHPGAPARGRRDVRGPRPRSRRPALGRLRQRGAPQGGDPGPRNLDGGGGPAPRHRPARPSGRPLQPSPVDGAGGGRGAGGGPGGRPGRDGGGPGGGRDPAPGHPVRGARPG